MRRIRVRFSSTPLTVIKKGFFMKQRELDWFDIAYYKTVSNTERDIEKLRTVFQELIENVSRIKQARDECKK